jgi:hypothetical protein
MCGAASIIRPLARYRWGAPVTAAQIGLVFVIGPPLAVVVAMIFWPSGYD